MVVVVVRQELPRQQLMMMVVLLLAWGRACPGSKWHKCQRSWRQQHAHAQRQRQMHAGNSRGSSSRTAVLLLGAARAAGAVGKRCAW